MVLIRQGMQAGFVPPFGMPIAFSSCWVSNERCAGRATFGRGIIMVVRVLIVVLVLTMAASAQNERSRNKEIRSSAQHHSRAAHHSSVGPAKSQTADRSLNKQLQELEKRTARVSSPKAAKDNSKLAAVTPIPRSQDKNQAINFNYRGPRQHTTTNQGRGSSSPKAGARMKMR